MAITINMISHRKLPMPLAIFGAFSLPMINPGTTGGNKLMSSPR